MYKINIKDSVLYLIATSRLKDRQFSKSALISPYREKTKYLLAYVDMLEKTSRFNEIVIHHHNIEDLIASFESLFRVVRASGGVVSNESKEVLMIFRKGSWDLPKGKINLNEKKRDAAIREVMEETGVNELSIHQRVLITRHIYRLKSGSRAIKKTYWYHMTSTCVDLIPQIEEDIEKVDWIKPNDFISENTKIFGSIVDVLKAAGHLD